MAGRQRAKSALAARRGRFAQRGAALLIFLAIIVTTALTYLVINLTPEAAEARRQRQTVDSLALAREALIGYALRYRDDRAAQDANSTGDDDRAMYGFLPMPDVGTSRFNAGQQNPACKSEGCAMDFVNGTFPAQNETIVGRLPWRTLGLPPLRDGHGECLWYMVSAAHKSLGINPALGMHWDTPGHLVVVAADGSGALADTLASAHDRPVAVIFAPGPPLPGQNRNASLTDDVSHCGGNYDAANYLDPPGILLPGGASNYLANANSASLATSDDAPKQILPRGPIYSSAGNLLPNACQGSDCTRVANDRGITLNGDLLFSTLRKNANFRTDINSMLDRMVNCLRDQAITPGTATPVPDNACYDAAQHPLGYFDHYRNQIFLVKPAGSLDVNGDASCVAALLFAGQRAPGQQRITAAQQADIANYLEEPNSASFAASHASFAGDALFERSPPQAAHQDIVRCVPAGGTFATTTSPTLAALGVGQLAAYDTATRTLTLGRANVVTRTVGSSNAAALFGCAWLADARPLGGGLRAYFRFRFMRVGTNVGSNGFVFALADAERNVLASCGAAGSHLGYSGDNGATPKVAAPKIGIEFDQGRDAGFPGSGGETAVNAGRNDPCGTTAFGCAGLGYNSHAAITYWGNATTNAADLVAAPDYDDNVHGFPAAPPALRPPPTNPAYPSAGFAFKDLRGKSSQGGDSYLYHVRVEITPLRNIAAAAEDSHTVVQTQVWLLADSTTVANQIAAMQNTTRPMSQLYPGFAAALQDTATLHDVAGASCASDPCPSGDTCGTDNICYRQALRTLRPGFTGSQRTTDQEVRISDFFTTWIP